MRFFGFCAGFFRESGCTESSTRLVGIMSFGTACGLAVYMVATKNTSPETQVILAQCFTAGAVALGLRKGSDPVPPAGQ